MWWIMERPWVLAERAESQIMLRLLSSSENRLVNRNREVAGKLLSEGKWFSCGQLCGMCRWAGVNVAAELRCELKARHACSRPAPSPGEESRERLRIGGCDRLG